MVSEIQAFRDAEGGSLCDHRSLSTFAIGAIGIYQHTVSKVTPPKCRFSPSCSQYAIDAVQEWGVWEGVRLTRERISRCRRPNRGFDPVPKRIASLGSRLASSQTNSTDDVTRSGFDKTKFEEVSGSNKAGVVYEYNHSFKLILSYPREREFLSREDLKLKIAQFNREVLQVDQYTLLFKIDKVEVGEINNYYLLRFVGSVSGEYLENSVDEIVGLLTAQLEGFFLVAQKKEFKALYFEMDGQTIYSPQAEQKTVIPVYTAEQDFWNFTSNPAIWDVYWGDFVVDTLSVLLDIASYPSLETSNGDLGAVELGDTSSPGEITTDGCGIDINPFDGDGCDAGGCDVDPFDGCDGCDGCSF
ncbi:membrane protein insertion efficiency factor YidD [Aliterella atlantica]|uniref:membrane protein insertion efficiency factor YidD n=1 Tax=Aliterella atlantica TaxID=1827278 RepID=UPI0009080B79|nr:membrane protein insertion efficiency factor YidD [Aliterella atlantica]